MSEGGDQCVCVKEGGWAGFIREGGLYVFILAGGRVVVGGA